MNIIDTKVYNIWKEAVEMLNGKLSVTFQQINGGSSSGGLYHLKVDIPYNYLTVQISTGLEEFPFQRDEYKKWDLLITATKKTGINLELSIWKKDYMDKIFSIGQSSTGYKEFDKVIAIKANRTVKNNLNTIFNNKALRKEIIEDKYRIYNVSTSDNTVNIKKKSSLRFETTEMIISEFNSFTPFLDGFIKAGLV